LTPLCVPHKVLTTPDDKNKVATELANLRQRISEGGGSGGAPGYNLAGIVVTAMTDATDAAASRGSGSVSVTPVGKAADAALERILNAKSAMANASSAASVLTAGGGLPGETEHVIAVDELWKEENKVCLLVQELRDGVVFCAHNIGNKSVLISLTVDGPDTNFEKLTGQKYLVPAGTKAHRLVRCRPEKKDQPWSFGYAWKVVCTSLDN